MADQMGNISMQLGDNKVNVLKRLRNLRTEILTLMPYENICCPKANMGQTISA